MKTPMMRICVAITVLFLAGVFLTSGEVLAQKEGGMLIYPLTAEPRPIDTQHQFGDKNCDIVCQHVYENLVWVDKDFKIQPWLATSWEMAPDSKSCVFHLRKGVTFHDGTPFDAKAVAANFKRMPDVKAWKFVGAWFESTEIIDDHTIRINLKQVYTPFLTEMAQLYTRMISPKAIETYGLDLGNNPSGTGPWKFSKWEPGERLVFTGNADYWQGKPRLEGLIFKITPDRTSRMMAFESRSFDILDQPQYMDIERMEKTGKYVSYTQPSSELFHLAFNNLKDPVSQKEVRKAIMLAVNRPAIVKSLLGDNVIVAYSFGPVLLPETLIKEDAFDFDPAKAKEILGNLGWKPGKDGILVKDGKRLEFSLMTPFGRYPMDKQISEAVQANLKDIGVNVKLEVVEAAAFINWVMGDVEQRKTTPVGMVALTRPLGATLEFAYIQHYHSAYRPKKGFNVSCFASEEFDGLMEKARVITDDKERSETYTKAQEILFDNMPVLPIYYYRSYFFTWPHVHEIGHFPPAYTPAPYVSHETWMDK